MSFPSPPDPLAGRAGGSTRRPRPLRLVRAAAGLVAIVLVTTACTGPSTPSQTAGAGGGGSPAASGAMTVYVPGGTYTSVAPGRLAEMLTGKDFILVNVHVPYEGEIDGTDAFIPFDQLAARRSELPGGPDAGIVLYCRSGAMSTEAARTLVDLGYTAVLELDGGMIAWEEAGFAIVRQPRG